MTDQSVATTWQEEFRHAWKGLLPDEDIEDDIEDWESIISSAVRARDTEWLNSLKKLNTYTFKGNEEGVWYSKEDIDTIITKKEGAL